MGPETVNKLKDSEIHGDFVGRDKITNIIMFQDSEREFIVTHNVNIKPVSYFTGRERELQELRQRIEAGRKSVLVSGMGGIGKTHICKKLFEEYLNKHAEDEDGPFRHIGYIEYNGDMGGSLQNCLKFKPQNSPEQNQEAAWRELEYLAADGKLLLFVDNVDRTIGEDSGLQRLKGIPGAVVLTSRQTSLCDEFEPFRIGFLDMGQCVEIYEKIRFEVSGRKIDPGEVEDLEYVIESLAGRHTITVELLAHLAKTKIWNVKRLRDELERKGFRLAFHKGGELVNIQESYEKLYDLSELTEAEQNILEAFSVFPYIPLAAEVCNEWLLADAGVSEDDDILMGLYYKGWLQFDIEWESYALHPVFAQFIYEKIKPDVEKHIGLIEACQECLKVPEERFSFGYQKKYIPYAENIYEKLDLENSGQMYSFAQIGLIGRLAYVLKDMGEYMKAERLYVWLIWVCGNVLGKENIYTVLCCDSLAEVYKDIGEYKKAEKLLEKSIQKYGKMDNENGSSIALCYKQLAELYVLWGKYEKAEKMYKNSLRICERIFGKEHPNITIINNGIAEIYTEKSKYERAKKLFEEGLWVSKKLYGEDHPSVGVCYDNLANMYMKQGKYEESKKLFEKSSKSFKGSYGECHPNVAISYNNLANLYVRLGEYEKAEDILEKSLRISKNVFTEKHPILIRSYIFLLYIYFLQNSHFKVNKFLKFISKDVCKRILEEIDIKI